MAGIVDYLKKQSGPASTEIKFADEPTAFVGENKVAIVSWSFSLEDFDNFSALAEKLRSDYDFGHPLNVKLLPRGESLSKPFNELFVDFQVIIYIVYHYYYIVPYNCVLLS
ncbi:Protein disulfide-isomerase [Glycine soja]